MTHLSILLFFGMDNLQLLYILSPFIIMIFYIQTLQKALLLCNENNRTLNPKKVWLLLIPFYNLIWNFTLVSHITTSLKNEFGSRSIQKETNFGKSFGIAYCVLSIFFVAFFSVYLGAIIGVPWITCWIVYWQKINTYSKELSNSNVQ